MEYYTIKVEIGIDLSQSHTSSFLSLQEYITLDKHMVVLELPVEHINENLLVSYKDQARRLKVSNYSAKEMVLLALEFYMIVFVLYENEEHVVKNQHIIAETFLKNHYTAAKLHNGFVDNKLLVQSSLDAETKLVNASDVFRGKKSYTDELEYFLGIFEDGYSNVLDKLKVQEMKFGGNLSKHVSEIGPELTVLDKIMFSFFAGSLSARSFAENTIKNPKLDKVTNSIFVKSKILEWGLAFASLSWTWIVVNDAFVFPFAENPIVRSENNSTKKQQLFFPITPRMLLIASEEPFDFQIKTPDNEDVMENYKNRIFLVDMLTILVNNNEVVMNPLLGSVRSYLRVCASAYEENHRIFWHPATMLYWHKIQKTCYPVGKSFALLNDSKWRSRYQDYQIPYSTKVNFKELFDTDYEVQTLT